MADRFLKMLGLEDDVDISVASTRFHVFVKEYIEQVRQNPHQDPKKIAQEEAGINALYKAFFPYSVSWVKATRKQYGKRKNHAEAEKLKEKGLEAIDEMQKNLIDFAICYMTIDRSVSVINAEMKNTRGTIKEIEWSSDTATMIEKNRKLRALLINRNKDLVGAVNLMAQISPKRANVEELAADIFGKEQSEKLMTSFRSGMRVGDFTKARSGLKKLVEQKTKFGTDKKKVQALHDAIGSDGEAYISFIEQNKDLFAGKEKKLYLKTSEVEAAVESNEKEIKQAEKFLRKYYRPYLKNQIHKLQHLRTKLMVAGSLESLSTLYIRMLRGIAEPLEDIKAVRQYESEVIENALYLFSTQFQEMKTIRTRIDEIMEDFASNMADQRDIEPAS